MVQHQTVLFRVTFNYQNVREVVENILKCIMGSTDLENKDETKKQVCMNLNMIHIWVGSYYQP